MTAPVVKHRGRGSVIEAGAIVARGKSTNGMTATLASSDKCPRCTTGGHLISDHVEEKARQCNLCACIAQDTDTA